MKAMVLAAGLGTRLGPYSTTVPKPLFPILGLPAIDWILASLKRVGVDQCVVNVHHLPDAIKRHLATHPVKGVEVLISHEQEILGTGGGIAKVADYFKNEKVFLVHNGDVFADFDLGILVERASRGDTAGVMALTDDEEQPETRLVEDQNGKLIGIRGKPLDLGGPKHVFSGVSAWTPRIFEVLPQNGPACLVADGIMRLLDNGTSVGAFFMPGTFCDIGTPRRFLDLQWTLFERAMNLFLAYDFGQLRRFRTNVLVHGDFEMGPGVGWDGPVFVGNRVVIGSGARIGPRVVLAKGARVAPGTRIHDAVVFEGAVVEGDVTGIVTGR